MVAFLTQCKVWQLPTLTWGDPTLPSALRHFTYEFGMGSSGTTALLLPDKFFFIYPVLFRCLLASLSPCSPTSVRDQVSAISKIRPDSISEQAKILSLKNTFGVVRLSLSGH